MSHAVVLNMVVKIFGLKNENIMLLKCLDSYIQLMMNTCVKLSFKVTSST